jgi:hypothetical protein
MKIIEDEIGLKGSIKIFTRKVGEDTWEKQVEKKNLIVDGARTMLRNKLSGTESSIYLQSFAFGTGTTAPSTSDTDLETPVPYSGANIYKAYEEYSEDDYKTLTFVGFLDSLEPVTQPVDLTEVGLFTGTGATAGTMYNRAMFDAVTKNTSLELRLEYTIII